MELAGYFSVLRRRWLTIVIVGLSTLAVSAMVTLAMPTKFTATTRLFFGVQSGESATDLSQGSTFAEKQMSSYAQVALSPLVLSTVILQLNLQTTPEQLAKSVIATIPTDTVILEIATTDEDPELAARISNAIGGELASVAANLSPPRPDGSESVRATTLAPAVVPPLPSSPNVLRNLGIGAILGVLLGIAAALTRDALDTKLRSEADLRASTNAPLLGVVPFDPSTPEHRLVISDGQMGGRAEAVRRLRTNLQFVGESGHPRAVVISSSVSAEGKTTTAINLAAALADGGLKTLLIDGDLRRPSVAEYLGIEGRAGLTTVLVGKAELADVIQQQGDRELYVVSSGPVPPNPSEILGSAAMRELMTAAMGAYDIVIVDSPPLLPVTDAAVLSRLAEGTIVVVGADRTHRHQLVGALEALEGVSARVLGVVLNKVARRDASRYGYEYGYAPYASTPEKVDSPEPRLSEAESAGAPPAGPRGGAEEEARHDEASRTWPPLEREQARR